MRIYKNPRTLFLATGCSHLQNSRGRFSIILSDLTSGNIEYSIRPQFYDLVTQSLRRGGLFFDKILTHPCPNLSIDLLVAKYSRLPLNLLYANHFSCEMLFCSELLEIANMVDSSMFYELLKTRAPNPRILAFIDAAQMVTPSGCRWWYGQRWETLKRDYCPSLELISTDEEEIESPYFGRGKHFILRRNH